MNLHLKAQLTAEDYASAKKLHMGILPLLIIIIFLPSAISLGLGWSSGFNNLPLICGSLIFSLLIIALWFPRILHKKIIKRTAKLFAQQKSLQMPYEIDITDEFFQAHSELGEGKVPWTNFHKWKYSPTVILVYQSDILFHIFMHRWFASDGEFQDFKNLLTKRIGPVGKAKN